MVKESDRPESESFALFDQYYDLLYREKDYLKETQYISSLILRELPTALHLLELGFGTGNYSKHLGENGFTVTGIEKSGQMVAVAQAKQIANFSPVQGDIITFQLDRKFDAAVSLFHVIGYLTENNHLLSCLKQVSAHLNKNGLFIFDVWYTPAVYGQQPETRVKRVSTESEEIIRIGEPVVFYEQNVVQVDYTLIVKDKASSEHRVFKERHLVRHFSTPEIKLMAQLSGFTVVGTEEFLTRKEPSAATWGVCYILRKND